MLKTLLLYLVIRSQKAYYILRRNTLFLGHDYCSKAILNYVSGFLSNNQNHLELMFSNTTVNIVNNCQFVLKTIKLLKQNIHYIR
jgi:hypothetical protein